MPLLRKAVSSSGLKQDIGTIRGDMLHADQTFHS
jgi:hypothetical protein